MPMRPLHWSKVPDAKVSGTIWLEEEMAEAKAALDVDVFESIFGLAETRGRSPTKDAALPDEGRGRAGSLEKKVKKEAVQLVDTKRSNNISIALARLRLSDEAMRAAVLDPVHHPLTPEQVSAILQALPTAEELEMVKEYSGDAESLGRVEKFFLLLSDVERLGPRLQALQATQQFAPQWETLSDEFERVLIAADQVTNSVALKAVLRQVLRLGNYLNGTSARGGAYGFKLADLGKLVQVKSADSKTTLLHYLARVLSERDAHLLETFKNELNALPEAKDIPIADKRAELAKLATSVSLAQKQLELGRQTNDAMAPLLEEFCEGAAKQLEELQADEAKCEGSLKKLAAWLAEKPSASTEDLFRPLADFVKALEKAQQDNVREAEAEKRKQQGTANAAGGWRKAGSKMGVGMGGMAGPGAMGGADKAMQAEMMLKMAQRAEKAATASGTNNQAMVQAQRQMLTAASTKASTKDSDASGGNNLAESLAGGHLFALKRAQAMQAGN